MNAFARGHSADEITEALRSSRSDAAVEYTVEDTTGLRVDDGDLVEGKKRTDTFTIADGQISDPQIGKARNMASEFESREVRRADAGARREIRRRRWTRDA